MPIFPPDFLWGTSTAAYQIEGAVSEGGRGPSIWDTFAHTPGKILGGETGDVTCDHYHRYPEDVALMRQLNLNAYRFSLAWPRMQPTGSGPLNPDGVAFYDRLLDSLLEAGIRPWVTLYHWDLPQALEDAGGWPERDTALRFADYAQAAHQRFGDRIADWTTLNEPWCSAFLGYFNGVHAPGRTDAQASLRAAHHLLLGHGLAVRAMREAKPEGRYGISLNIYPVDPASDSAADTDAARQVDGVSNRLFTDPILGGGEYPADVIADLGHEWPSDVIEDGDAAILATPIDMLGVNYYTRQVVRGGADAGNTDAFDAGWVGCAGIGGHRRGLPVTAMNWEIDPPGLYDVLTRLREAYPTLPDVYVTENGAAFDDVVDNSGSVQDAARVEYLREHFTQARRSIDAGVPLRGYFVWSLLDNFEWSFGTSKRFGVVRVDFTSQRRTVKASGHFVAAVAARNGFEE